MIKGSVLRDAIISGANVIENKKRSVDELNIFPVPDGDTGTNMSMTMTAGRKELMQMGDDETVATVSAKAASALLRGARGNSGVITSLLFRGFSKGLKDKEEADGAALATALTQGVEAAYKAVMKPTEGTILTVARVAAERGRVAASFNNDANYVWDEICAAAEDALETTPDLLPVLKRAGVVDAGGQGLCLIFRGMQSVFRDGIIAAAETENAAAQGDVDSFNKTVAQFDEVINFTYCTEFIVEKENTNDPAKLRAYLESIGDCVVVVDDEEIIKVHVHTNQPGDAITKGLTYGSLISNKIENMRKQHENAGAGAPKKLERVDPVEGEVGFVAVAAGDGLVSLFHDLGCENVVSGGQTMNPSTEDILEAVQATAASTVFVLPNNKNIIMAAEQAVPLADRRVIVLPTKTIPQGLTAMLTFDADAGADENATEMFKAAERVSTGQVTYAARNSEFNDKKIKEGEMLGLINGKLTFTEKSRNKAILKLAKHMIDRGTSFITLIYGAEVTDDEAEETRRLIETKIAKNVEVTLVNGGQPVYYYILSVE
ncbi:MAG: DAK2 domain-containing protein [Clostridia bacterium]|nr:DAK2 domain-containing protein [Clostridia bacterium]